MGISPRSDFLGALYQSWSDHMAANPGLAIADLYSLFDRWHQSTLEPKSVIYKSDWLAGIKTIWTLPQSADTKQVTLHAHGGGPAVGFADSHRKLTGHLAKHLGMTVMVTDYRYAPEHPFPAQIEGSTTVYKGLLARGSKSADIITGSDPTGNNLTISTVLRLHQDGVALPAAVTALSPWLGMERTGKTSRVSMTADTLVGKAVPEGMSGTFLGKKDSRTDPLASPPKADFRGLSHLHINAGTVETSLDNAQGLARIAKVAGVDVVLSVVDSVQHVFPFLTGQAPEADDELRRIVHWFKHS